MGNKKAKYSKNRRKKLLSDGQGATKKKPDHVRTSKRHMQSFKGAR